MKKYLEDNSQKEPFAYGFQNKCSFLKFAIFAGKHMF